MAKTPFTKGLVTGKTTGFINQSRNTAIDNTTYNDRNKKLLAAHVTKGVKPSTHPTRPSRPTRGVTGARQGGGSARIRGGGL